MSELMLIALCILAILAGMEYIQKEKSKPGLEPVTQNLEIHPGFEENQVILWNGGNGITVDKKDFRAEFLHMSAAEIYTELQEKRRNN